ncbi:FAD-binding oxidoreductase [Microbacterium sp. NPDC057659]|uniref:FAD-binding oxidoreductase n=1 Tax=Microbacterium sp. NPDC057659 TaxID=3346198 RepID=UPI00366D44B2
MTDTSFLPATADLPGSDPHPDGVRIVHASDPEWDELRATYSLLLDQQPAAIAVPHDADEVAAAVRYARAHGLRVAAQATGHGATTLGDLADTLLVRTLELDEVDVDPATGHVRVGAGVRWSAVVPQLAEAGFAARHGSSPTVGIVGYSLGSGIGWLSRKHGLQPDAVTAIDCVLADGTRVRADAENHSDLFWALRGAGGNAAVVTAIEFDTVRQPRVYGGGLSFSIDKAAEVLQTWTDSLADAPEELTTWATLYNFPDAPHLPDAIRGRSFVSIMGVYLGAGADADDASLEAEARRLLEPFLSLGPFRDTFAPMSPVDIPSITTDPPGPVSSRGTTAQMSQLTPETIAQVVELMARKALMLVQFRHVGGALHRPAPGGGVRETVPGDLTMYSVGILANPDARPAVLADQAALDEIVAPFLVGRFAGFIEAIGDPEELFPSGSLERLNEIVTRYDPEGVFRSSKPVPVL